jgi:hypothetical protein
MAMVTPTESRRLAQPNPAQRRLLRTMEQGNPIWEIADAPHCTVYHEKTGRDQRLRRQRVEQIEALGWIRRVPNPSQGRLDSWEITELGRAVLASKD